ncbi:MAG: hypothetical protein K2G40_01140, partial [Muribaculaceae bacterium]|nr:hypothetical protein [Muribaculaceae bacterium]
MKHRIVKNLLLASVALVVPFCAGARSSWNDEADARKADYMFMEAQRQMSLDNTDAYYELLRT